MIATEGAASKRGHLLLGSVVSAQGGEALQVLGVLQQPLHLLHCGAPSDEGLQGRRVYRRLGSVQLSVLRHASHLLGSHTALGP